MITYPTFIRLLMLYSLKFGKYVNLYYFILKEDNNEHARIPDDNLLL